MYCNLFVAGSTPSTVLHEVMLPILPKWICNQVGWYGGTITDAMICAGFPEGGKDTCQVGAIYSNQD